MLSTVTIKANVTKLEDTGYWHSGQAHNPDNPAQTAWFDHQKIEKIHVEQGVGVCSEPWEVIGDWGGYVTSPIQEGRIADIWYYAYVNTNQSKWNQHKYIVRERGFNTQNIINQSCRKAKARKPFKYRSHK